MTNFLGAECHPLDFERGLFLVLKYISLNQMVIYLHDEKSGETKWKKKLDRFTATLLGFSSDYVAVIWNKRFGDLKIMEIYSNITGETLVSFPTETL